MEVQREAILRARVRDIIEDIGPLPIGNYGNPEITDPTPQHAEDSRVMKEAGRLSSSKHGNSSPLRAQAEKKGPCFLMMG